MILTKNYKYIDLQMIEGLLPRIFSDDNCKNFYIFEIFRQNDFLSGAFFVWRFLLALGVALKRKIITGNLSHNTQYSLSDWSSVVRLY